MNYPYNNFVNPYQMQQPVYNQMFAGLQGKVVNSFEEISANDVSMNQPSVFVKSDMSEIEIRKWANNGMIERVSYVKTNNSIPIEEKSVNDTKFCVEKAFNEVNDRLDKIEKSLGKKVKYESKAISNANVESESND